MNYIPKDIVEYIYSIVEQYYISYFHAFNLFLKQKYHCDLYVLKQYYEKPSVIYIFVTYTGKSVDTLYKQILLFNLKYKHQMSIKKSVYIINNQLKKNIKEV